MGSRLSSLTGVLAFAASQLIVPLPMPLAQSPAAAKSKPRQQREFEFLYGGTLVDLPPGASVRVWMPVPESGPYQQVEELAESLPGRARTTSDSKYGNVIRYFETDAPADGTLQWNRKYRIVRQEARVVDDAVPAEKLTKRQRELFLEPNTRVPVNGKPDQLLRGVSLPDEPLDLGRVLYAVVDKHVTYDKSKPGYGNGDSNWVCHSRFGNCTDFHSLFISLARGRDLPAKFEIGFPLPSQRGHGEIGGYHCWGWFFDDNRGWIPVDISEADKNPAMKNYYFGNLTENRVAFSRGRDIQLVPAQAAPPLNYFVYPHVEIDGKVWPKESTKLEFRYQDKIGR